MTYRCVLVTEEKLERQVQIFANDFTNAILAAKQLLAKYAEAKIVIYKEVEIQLGYLTKAGYLSTDSQVLTGIETPSDATSKIETSNS